MALFPPLLDAYQPSFPKTKEYKVYFQLPNYQDINSIEHVQVKITYASNGKSLEEAKILSGFQSNKKKMGPDGIIYIEGKPFKEGGLYYIVLNIDWDESVYYKLQLRFGATKLWQNSLEKFVDWKTIQINNNTFSEWSTVMALKCIPKPKVGLGNQKGSLYFANSERIITTYTESSTTPLFYGTFSCDDATENIDKYKFLIYDAHTNQLLEDSGWLQHNTEQDIDGIKAGNSYRFKQQLVENKENNALTYDYYVIYKIITNNYYEGSSDPYNFKVATYDIEYKYDIMYCDDSDCDNIENGRIAVMLKPGNNICGHFVLTRASEKTNYTVWEDLKYFTLVSNNDIKVLYYDYTIESGVGYKYILKQINALGHRSVYYLDTTNGSQMNSQTRRVFLDYAYIYENGIQLKLKFDNKMSSFKRTKLSQKIDTIGSKYATIMQNNIVNYAEFPITGIISFQLDTEQTFFKWKENEGYYFKNELVIPCNRFEKIENNRLDKDLKYNYIINSGINAHNIYMEKIFREKAEEFLSDGHYKLFRSPTEGNMIISIINSSLAPNEQLSRMISTYSGTAYEVAECSIENLDKFNIATINPITDYTFFDSTFSFLYQVQAFGENVNIFDIVKEKEEVFVKGTKGKKKYQIKNFNTIIFEAFPEYTDYYKQLIESEKDGYKRAEYERLLQGLKGNEKFATACVELNGQTLYIDLTKPYVLTNLNLPVDSTLLIKYPSQLLVSVVGEKGTVENLNDVVCTSMEGQVWGSYSGIFTNNKYEFNGSCNNIPIKNIYRLNDELNLRLIIEQEILSLIKKEVGDIDFAWDQEKQLWISENKKYRFKLADFLKLTMETDKGNGIKIVGNNGFIQNYYFNDSEYINLQDTSDLNYDLIIADLNLLQPCEANIEFRVCFYFEEMGVKK